MSLEIPADLMRGGTSRGLVIRAQDLPKADEARFPLFQRAVGSPDPSGRQVDGVGGGNASTSKVAVVATSTRPDCDVDYAFYQIGVRTPDVDTRGNCGNLTSAVAVFAVNEGWVSASGAEATVRIWNTNTQRRIEALVPVEAGRARVHGDYVVHGVPGSGAPIRLTFLEPGGSVTGSLLPSGQPQERMALPDGEELTVSLVDAANPIVLARAEELGVAADVSPEEIEGDAGLMQRLGALRASAAVRLGFASTVETADRESAAVPFVGFVGPSPRNGDGTELQVRFLSSGTAHRALPLTTALATAVAARIAGTVAHEACGGPAGGDGLQEIRLVHPTGTLVVEVDASGNGEAHVVSAGVTLTARTIMRGAVIVPT